MTDRPQIIACGSIDAHKVVLLPGSFGVKDVRAVPDNCFRVQLEQALAPGAVVIAQAQHAVNTNAQATVMANDLAKDGSFAVAGLYFRGTSSVIAFSVIGVIASKDTP